MPNASTINRHALFFGLLLALGTLGSSAAFGAAAYPYPQNVTYAYGSRPANPYSGSWATDSTTLYNKWTQWKTNHITTSGAGGAGRMRVQRNSANGNDTVSEGISYGMLLCVYFNDQATFDALWGYKTLHNDGLGLMNWKIDAGGTTAWDGYNSATDADEDIAYSLYLAHRQWGSGGTLNYKSLADAEVNKIRSYCLDSNRVKPGDSFNSCRYPSYFFPNEYRVFGKETGNTATWDAVRTNSYNTIAAARNSGTGLIAEQCTDGGQGGGCSVSSTRYEYNSCRVPFRMALDYVYYGDANAAAQLDKMNVFFGSIAPASLGDGYNISGGATSYNNNGAFVGPAATGFMRGGGANLQSYYNHLMTLNHTAEYYNGALQLLTLLLLQGNMPNIGDPGAIYTATPSMTRTPYAGTPTFTATTTPIAFAWVFEDFEAGAVAQGYTYIGTGSTIAYAATTADSHSPTYSDKMTVNLAASSYAGHGFVSNYRNANNVMDMTGSTKVRFWMKTDKDVTFRLSFREGTAASGGDDEVWQSLPITAFAGGWTAYETALSTWTEDIYNGSCQPTCLTSGNNTFNLTSVKTAQFGFSTASTATVYVDDIVFIPSVAPTPTPTRTPFDQPYNQVFDDIEAPRSLSQTVLPKMADAYSDTVNGASASIAAQSGTVASGLRAGAITYNSGTGASYGCGGFLMSPYSTPGLYVDASGAVMIGMWLYSSTPGLKYKLAIQEAGTSTSSTAGAEGEAFESSILTTGTGWQWVETDIAPWGEDIYNPVCQPNCLTKGDGIKDLQAISSVTLKIQGNQGSGTLYFDDVTFITTWKTATPTVSPSPSVSPTRSPSPSASPSASPSFSPTPSNSPSLTPSASPSLTATSTRTPMGTFTDSPTETPFAGTPTFTEVATSTYSPSPVATFTATPTASPSPPATLSFTLTQTPLPGTSTFTPTLTQTPLPGTSTFTPSATLTPTQAPPSDTPTLTGTPLPGSPTHSPSSTRTSTPGATPTATPPTPVLGSLSPANASTGAGFTLTVNGSLFQTGAEILIDGSPLATVYVGPTQLTASVPSLAVGTYTITVRNSAGGTPSSGSSLVIIAGPVPTATFTPVGSGPGVANPETGGPPILATRPLPNPNPSSLRVQLNGKVDSLEVKVYTAALTSVGSSKIGPCGTAGAKGWVELPLPASLSSAPTDGLYFYVVTAQKNGSKSDENGTGRMMLVR